MPNPRKPELAAEAQRRNREQFARIGGDLRDSRKRRRLTQQQLGAMADLSQSGVSLAERGHGGSLSMDTWQRLFTAVDRRLIVEAPRDPLDGVADAGHLAVQELILRLGRPAGYAGSFELQTGTHGNRHSVDVALRNDRTRTLLLVEAWNSIGDLGAAVRATSRKVAEAESLAVALGGDRPYRVASCWVVRATARNRELVGTYPHIFTTRFPASSTRWVQALIRGSPPPEAPGLVWCDVGATRLFAWRRSIGGRRADDARAGRTSSVGAASARKARSSCR